MLSMVNRINQKLKKQVPRKRLIWDRALGDYYLHIENPDTPRGTIQGPYHWRHLVALGDHVNAFKPEERTMRPLAVITQSGKHVPQLQRLPMELTFDVITEAALHMAKQLRGEGWICEPGGKVTRLPDPELPPDTQIRTEGKTVTQLRVEMLQRVEAAKMVTAAVIVPPHVIEAHNEQAMRPDPVAAETCRHGHSLNSHDICPICEAEMPANPGLSGFLPPVATPEPTDQELAEIEKMFTNKTPGF